MTVEIHENARVSRLADIEASVRGTRIVIGDGVVIDSFVKIKPVGGIGDVLIGNNTFINSGCVLYSGNGITIGPNSAIAANCTFAATNHGYHERDKLIMHQGFLPSKGGIILGTDVWIGANCVLLDGAKIGDGCVIAAGSIVRSELDAYGVYAGTPLKKIGERE